jgi:uncharacterized protein YuzE
MFHVNCFAEVSIGDGGMWQLSQRTTARAAVFAESRAMKLHYPETDSLYIELKDTPGVETREIVEGLVVDLDHKGDLVGFDIDQASGKLDLSKVGTIAPGRHRGGVIRAGVIRTPLAARLGEGSHSLCACSGCGPAPRSFVR